MGHSSSTKNRNRVNTSLGKTLALQHRELHAVQKGTKYRKLLASLPPNLEQMFKVDLVCPSLPFTCFPSTVSVGERELSMRAQAEGTQNLSFSRSHFGTVLLCFFFPDKINLWTEKSQDLQDVFVANKPGSFVLAALYVLLCK